MIFINQIRNYQANFTESELFVPEMSTKLWVLEDIGRPFGVKWAGETCIPEGVYNVTISMSNRFKKRMMLLSNKPDGSLERYGVRFTGIRPHGGNKIDDTHGCPLCNYHTDHKGKQWGRASDDIFDLVEKWINQGQVVKWAIN